jgi:hypothetical protein
VKQTSISGGSCRILFSGEDLDLYFKQQAMARPRDRDIKSFTNWLLAHKPLCAAESTILNDHEDLMTPEGDVNDVGPEQLLSWLVAVFADSRVPLVRRITHRFRFRPC